MSLCTDRTIVNTDEQIGTIHALKCKCWHCEICQPENRMRVMHRARKGEPNVFMTLTVAPQAYATPDHAARDMKRSLVALRRRIHRRWNIKNLPFLVVFERHKSGWPHMHLVIRAPFMKQQVLAGMWRDIIGRGSVDIRFIKSKAQVLFYVTKYIGKDLAAFKGCKRFWTSRNWCEPCTEDDALHLFGERLYQIQMPVHKAVAWLERHAEKVEKVARHKWFFEMGNGRSINSFRPALYERRGEEGLIAYGDQRGSAIGIGGKRSNLAGAHPLHCAEPVR